MRHTKVPQYYNVSGRDARRHERINEPVFEVHFNNGVWRPLNWSVGGLLIRPYDGSLKPDDVVRGFIVGATFKGPERVPFTARVIRHIQRRKELALQFTSVDERLRHFFEHYLRRPLRPTR
jgi:hypothetical protein